MIVMTEIKQIGNGEIVEMQNGDLDFALAPTIIRFLRSISAAVARIGRFLQPCPGMVVWNGGGFGADGRNGSQDFQGIVVPGNIRPKHHGNLGKTPARAMDIK